MYFFCKLVNHVWCALAFGSIKLIYSLGSGSFRYFAFLIKSSVQSSRKTFGYVTKILKYCSNPRSVGISHDNVLAIVSIDTATSCLVALVIRSNQIENSLPSSWSMFLFGLKSGLYCRNLISYIRFFIQSSTSFLNKLGTTILFRNSFSLVDSGIS